MGALIARLARLAAALPVRTASAFYNALRASPVLGATFATLGIQGVYDYVASNPEAMAELLRIAADFGIDVSSEMAAAGVDLSPAKKAVSTLGAIFTDNDNTSIAVSEADRIKQLKSLGQFIRSEISSDPGQVVRYHAMMREFMNMDQSTVANFADVFVGR